MAKQQINLKSPIKDVNEHLNGIVECFNPLHPIFSPGSRVVDHFSSRVKFHSPLSLSEDDLHLHLQKLNYVFNMSQVSLHSSAVIADSGVKKSHAASAVAHIWVNNSNIKQLQMHSTHVTPNEAELMAIRIGLIYVMEINDMHDIIVITDSISIAQKILESNINPFQNIVILLATKIKSYLSKDARNNIYFWYYLRKANWPRHKLINDQVKASNFILTIPCKHSHLFSKKKECDDILQDWQKSFLTSLKKGHYFLNFEDEKQITIKSTYAKGSSWLPFVGFTNSLCAHFTHMTTGHAPIGEYCQRLFSQSQVSCPCGAEIQTHEHIVMECDLYDPSTRPCNIIINSFVHFLADNPAAFSFDNG